MKKLSSSTSVPPFTRSPSAIFEDSYAVKWMAVNGTFIAKVVGYDRYSARIPWLSVVFTMQSHTPLYGELCICRRCLTVSTGVCTASPTTVAHAPAKAWWKGWCLPVVGLHECFHVFVGGKVEGVRGPGADAHGGDAAVEAREGAV